MAFKIIAGDFSKGGKITFFLGETWLREATDITDLKGNIDRLETLTDDAAKGMLASVAWGAVGWLAFGVLGAAAGLLKGGNRRKVCFACYLKDGRKFMAVADGKTYQKLAAIAFDQTESSTEEDVAIEPVENETREVERVIVSQPSVSLPLRVTFLSEPQIDEPVRIRRAQKVFASTPLTSIEQLDDELYMVHTASGAIYVGPYEQESEDQEYPTGSQFPERETAVTSAGLHKTLEIEAVSKPSWGEFQQTLAMSFFVAVVVLCSIISIMDYNRKDISVNALSSNIAVSSASSTSPNVSPVTDQSVRDLISFEIVALSVAQRQDGSTKVSITVLGDADDLVASQNHQELAYARIIEIGSVLWERYGASISVIDACLAYRIRLRSGEWADVGTVRVVFKKTTWDKTISLLDPTAIVESADVLWVRPGPWK